MTKQEDAEFTTVRVPRNAFVLITPRPATVTTRNVEANFGMTPGAFKRMARDGLFATKRVGRVVFAAYDDVERAVTEGATARKRFEKAFAAVNETPIDQSFSLRDATAYLDGARTRAELRERKSHVSSKGWALVREHDEKLRDGAPNPKFNKALFERGLDLVLTAAGILPSR